MNENHHTLEALVKALGDGWRLTASATGVKVEDSTGIYAAEIAWSEDQHRHALSLCKDTQYINLPHLHVEVFGEYLLLRRRPQSTRRLGQLVSAGWLSDLAAQFLDAALSTKRNILVCGPQIRAMEFSSAMLAGGDRAMTYGEGWPMPWAQLRTIKDARAFGGDRCAVLHGGADIAAQALGGMQSVVAWIDSTRIDRTMMRYELAAGGVVQVLASLDLLVVLSTGAVPRIEQVLEFTPSDDSYQGQLLFSTGIAPAPQTLTPLQQPSFINDLSACGHQAVAEELRHATAAPTPQTASSITAQTSLPAAPVITDPRDGEVPLSTLEPHVEYTVRHEKPDTPTVTTEQAVYTVHPDAPPPGWELDQLGDDVVDANDQDNHAPQEQGPDASLMAATYGLAPPPRPNGVVSTKGVTTGFAEALARAKERDAQLQDSLAVEDTADAAVAADNVHTAEPDTD